MFIQDQINTCKDRDFVSLCDGTPHYFEFQRIGLVWDRFIH